MDASYRSSRRRFLKATAALAAAGTFNSAHFAFGAEPDLIVRSADPYNAEPPLIALVADQITPVKHFYVRNHGPTPKIAADGYKLRVEGMVERPLELSLAEIRQDFPQFTIEATLTCAGNRRQEMSAVKPVGGVQWDAGAIGHAQWSGASLASILRFAGIKPGAKHVWLEGQDGVKEKDGSIAPFGGSIPIRKASPARIPAGSIPAGKKLRQIADAAISATALLAYSMNNQPLTPEHGFPLRVVVPGYIGARSVKWLTKITVSDRPSPNHYVAEAYKLVQSDDKDEAARAEPIYAFPVNAAICSPAVGATIKAGKTLVGGYALPSGDVACTVAKVEVSSDGGRNWTEARLIGKATPFTWQQWTAMNDLPPGKHDLVVRATDSRGNTMPENGEWNSKGYLYNGWHHVSIEAV